MKAILDVLWFINVFLMLCGTVSGYADNRYNDKSKFGFRLIYLVGPCFFIGYYILWPLTDWILLKDWTKRENK